jgi:tripartite-type tricarboxylate transporter receptor subunit TctC
MMDRLLFVALCVGVPTQVVAGTPKARELIHAYPSTGPVEVSGHVTANKVLRTMQRHATPAFSDVLAAHVAQTLQGASNDHVAVIRRPRQGGREALESVASAAGNGRTLLLANTENGVGLQHVALIASMPYVLIVPSASAHENVQALLRAPRLFIGTPGERSAANGAIARLRAARVQPVGYNGGIAALHAAGTQQVGAALVPLPAALPYFGAGRVRVLAIADARRHSSIPQTPTTAESGLAGFDAVSWFGVLAPAATPPAVIRELSLRLADNPKSQQAREIFAELGLWLEYEAGAAAFRDQRGITGITSREGLRPPS